MCNNIIINKQNQRIIIYSIIYINIITYIMNCILWIGVQYFGAAILCWKFGALQGIMLLVIFIFSWRMVLRWLGYERMNSHCALFMYEFPGNSSKISACWITEKLSKKDIEFVTQKILEREQNKRFTQRIVEICGSFYWTADHNFSPANHLHHIERQISTNSGLMDIMNEVMLRPFPRSRSIQSPWSLHIVYNFQSDKSALIFSLSHSIADGPSLLHFICQCCEPRPQYHTKLVPAYLYVYDLLLWLVFPLMATYYYGKTWFTRDRNSLLQNTPLQGVRHCVESKEYSLNQLKHYSGAHGLNVTDLFIGAVCLAAQDYSSNITKLKIGMPINQRPEGDPLHPDNVYGYAMLDYEIPSIRDSESLREFIYRIGAQNRAYKAGPWPFLNYISAKIPDLFLPSELSYKNSEFFAGCSTLLLASIGGPTHEVKLNGKRTLDFFYMSSCVGKTCISLGLRSYQNSIKFIFYADIARIDNPKYFVELIDSSLWQILGSL